MKEVTEEDVLNNWNFWCRADDISSISKEVTLNQIASKIGDSKSNSYFCGLMKFLEENNFLVVDRSRIPHLIKVKCSELAWFLTENENPIIKRFLNNTKVRMGFKPYYTGL